MNLRKKIVISLISFWGTGIILALVFVSILVLQRNLTISRVQASPGPACTVSDDLEVTGNLTVGGNIYGWNVPSSVKTTTPNIHNGDFGGYQAMYNWIQTNGCSGYHVCDAAELTRWAQTGGALLGGVSDSRFNGGVAYGVADCSGWTTSNSGITGYVWWVDEHMSSLLACNVAQTVACCK